jgi:glycosyltransferase involved in cell wall biosynthesis
MSKPIASVIIPVYNTEKYVKEAVLSIVRQTLHNIEIIIVNDGSTDNSGIIIGELAKNDTRIRVINCNNGGQSTARNTGTNEACGKYLYYMDSDDFLEPDALEMCLEACNKSESDFLFFNGDTMEGTTCNFGLRYKHKELKERTYTGSIILEKLIDNRDFIVSPCLYFIKRSYLMAHGIGFYPGIIHEDQLFSFRLFFNAEKVTYLNRTLFKRRLREDSTMTKKFSMKNINGYMTVANEISGYLKKDYCTRQERRIIDKYLILTLNAVTYNAHELPIKEKIAYIFLCLKQGYMRYLSARNIAVMFLKR